MLQWLNKLIKEWIIPQKSKQYDPAFYKSCEDCNGLGIDDPHSTCLTCNGEGVVEKTRKEIWLDELNSHLEHNTP